MVKQEDTKSPALGVGGMVIKSEPGTSASPVMQRLPSLRPPRDLSLSAYSQKIPSLNQSKNKKDYKPNLNVQRNKTSENAPTVKSEFPKSHEETKRTRGKPKRSLVQLNQGVFAEGIPGLKTAGRGRFSGGSGDRTESVLQRPTLKLKADFKVDKKEEENTMKQLLRDDFVDDPNLEPDFDNCPITLPLLNCKEDPGLKKKCDLKPIDKKEYLTINDVFCDSTAPDSGYIFFQLPSSMPGLKPESSEDGPKHSSQAASTTTQQTASAKPEVDRCLLSSLPGGLIGKLQILKSGRARLVFGDTKMWLEMGTQVAFKQDLMSFEPNKESWSGHMINLGPINARMVATPDWESIISAIN